MATVPRCVARCCASVIILRVVAPGVVVLMLATCRRASCRIWSSTAGGTPHPPMPSADCTMVPIALATVPQWPSTLCSFSFSGRPKHPVGNLDTWPRRMRVSSVLSVCQLSATRQSLGMTPHLTPCIRLPVAGVPQVPPQPALLQEGLAQGCACGQGQEGALSGAAWCVGRPHAILTLPLARPL